MKIRTRLYNRFHKSFLQSVDEQIKNGVPLNTIYKSFLRTSHDHMEYEEMLAHYDIQNSIEDILVDRNVNGKQLEKDGRTEDAVELYEANVADCFDGSHPYDRLRIIYSKHGRYSEAIRVCEAYLKNDNPGKDEQTFQQHVDNLRSRIRP